jgi:hypothetical protein
MIPKRSIVFLAILVVAMSALAPIGCNVLLGGGYVVGAEDGGATQPDSSTPDNYAAPTSDSGDAGTPPDTYVVDACAIVPMDKQQFESACTNASCQPFDNPGRNTNCEGGTICPALPTPDAGATTTPDAGAPIPDGGVSCFSLTQGPAGGVMPQPIVYATGSTAIQPYMARIAQVLESLNIGSVVYLGSGSCLGVNAMLNGTPLQQVSIQNKATIPPQATYYDSVLNNGQVQSGTCYLDNPIPLPDLGISDVFPTTCDPQLISQGGLPNTLHDFFGPVQTMELVVPSTSMEQSVSTEALYMVFGFGAGSGVTPWTNPGYLEVRASSSGTQNMIAATIGVPATQWQGVANSSSTGVLDAIIDVAKGLNVDGGAGEPSYPDETMGILASDVADPSRMYLKPLALQDVGQSCGWYPDSTQTAFDKQNVRDGHYPIWGPSHLIAAVNTTGAPVNPAVTTVINALNGADTMVDGTLDVIQFYASSHIIPECAMHVQRTEDGHDYAPFAPTVSCSCYYDLEATGATSCKPCKTDPDCADAGASTTCQTFGIPPVGYCEPPGNQ